MNTMNTFDINYGRIISDIGAGIIAYFIFIFYKSFFSNILPNFDMINNINLASLSIFLLLTVLLGKLSNLFGYFFLGKAQDLLIPLMMAKTTDFGDKIVIGRDIKFLKQIELLIQHYCCTMYSGRFRSDEGFKRFLRTLSFFSIISSPLIYNQLCNWGIIQLASFGISLVIILFIFYLSCFARIYLLGKYYQNALIIIRTHTKNISYEGKNIKAVLDDLYRVLCH